MDARTVIHDVTVSLLAVILIGALAVLAITQTPVPPELSVPASAVVGYFFGFTVGPQIRNGSAPPTG